jgi:predicted metallopeptidase
MFSKSADVFPFAKNLAQNALENIFQKSVDPAFRTAYRTRAIKRVLGISEEWQKRPLLAPSFFVI